MSYKDEIEVLTRAVKRLADEIGEKQRQVEQYSRWVKEFEHGAHCLSAEKASIESAITALRGMDRFAVTFKDKPEQSSTKGDDKHSLKSHYATQDKYQ